MNFLNFDNNTEDNFYDKNYSEIDNNSAIVDNILKNNKTKPTNENLNEKLTHNDCILIYLNPNISSKNKFKTALNHINECEVCKNQISKKNNMEDKKEKRNVSFKNDKSVKENFVYEKKEEKPIIIEKNNDYVKILQDEQNLKYQNLMLENTMSKYLENIEERKKLNDNIEKILSLLKKNKTNDEKDFNYYGNNNITTNNLFLYFLFFVIIVLLIIDIFIKIKN
jgi:hypothetical protein